ncbi:DUF2505 domain-containing protein [Paenarthrobacter sp. Z7-10]|uniref:DUF2505 domain-containing protein n=1 Tax=Paenarthrobacter sp. Z7-10 TaxID=2787635 RepID=UPI0022A950DF|nr:DUF2505 domain-containing protein [Paenarthrobacter sp. Z7-10]MCZ2404903.1 DUF2505 domain-containing protein [Paenarthrobacter sp. Z7-10]
MPLKASSTLSATVQRVTEVFTDEAFVRHTSESVGGTLESFVRDGNVQGAFSTTTVRTLPTDRLPELARKFVGSSLTVTQHEDWSVPAADGSREVQVKLTVSGAPLDVTAVERLTPDDGGTRVDLEGAVRSSIPFLGNKIADAAEPMISKALKLQTNEARGWLSSHSA